MTGELRDCIPIAGADLPWLTAMSLDCNARTPAGPSAKTVEGAVKISDYRKALSADLRNSRRCQLSSRSLNPLGGLRDVVTDLKTPPCNLATFSTKRAEKVLALGVLDCASAAYVT